MKHRSTVFLLAAAAVALAPPSASSAPPTRRLDLSPSQREALGIEVVRLEPVRDVGQPRLPGHVRLPNEKTRIVAAPVAGLVTDLEVATGDAISRGQVLARLESPDFVQRQRELLEALSQRDLARATHARERRLSEEGIIAGRRAEASAARLREAEALAAERRQALSILGLGAEAIGELEASRRLQPALSLRAPFSGVVLEQHVATGEQLEAGAPVYRIGELDRLQVEVHVPIEIASGLREGRPFAIPAHAARGRIVAIGRDVHALDQGVLVRGEIEDASGSLRPGQFVGVELRIEGGLPNVFEVPDSAVVHVAQQPFVFRELADGFEPVAVQILGGSDRRLVITGPLEAGQALAARGTSSLKAEWLAVGGLD